MTIEVEGIVAFGDVVAALTRRGLGFHATVTIDEEVGLVEYKIKLTGAY